VKPCASEKVLFFSTLSLLQPTTAHPALVKLCSSAWNASPSSVHPPVDARG